MFTPQLLPLVLCILRFAHPILTATPNSDSDTIISDGSIVAPSLQASPLLVSDPHFIVPENTVTGSSDTVLIESDSFIAPQSSDNDPANQDETVSLHREETGDTTRPPVDESMEQHSTLWTDLDSNDNEEIDTEQPGQTTTAEDILQTQAIPIGSYVVIDRKAKSELLPPNRNIPEAFLQDQTVPLQSLDLTVKNLTSDPEDLENALFNDTVGTSSVEEEQVGEAEDQDLQVDQSKEASDESFVTDNAYVEKQVPLTTTTTSTQLPPPTNHLDQSVVNQSHRKKQPKYIKKFRASASEVLRFFMEGSYLRAPLAVLVDTSDKTLQKTKILWKATLQESTTENIDMVLVTFDHSGIYATYKFNNSRTLVAGLNSIQPSSKTDQEISTHTDNVFSTVIRAAERIPYDSAIFLFTNSEPVEDEVAQTAAIMLLKKRIRLYLFWFGGVDNDPETQSATSAANSANNNPNIRRRHQYGNSDVAGILGEVTLRTGGEIVYMSSDAIHPNGDIGTVTLQLRNSFQGVEPFGVALSDSETNVLNRSHESSEETGRLPAEHREETSKKENIGSSTSTNSGGDHPIYPRSSSGKDAEVIFSPDTISEASLRMSENIRFPDSNLQASVLENEESEVESSNPLEVDQNEKDEEIEVFATDGKETRQSAPAIESNTQILVSPQSKLTSLPGTQAQIIFEVTNLRSALSVYYFTARDEQNYVRQTQPQVAVSVGPGQTITVTVNVFVPLTAAAGTRNKITFTVRGVTDVQQAVYFTVTGNTPVQDSWAPTLSWNYGSRCEWKSNPGVCSQHVWSVEVTAQDWDTGILRLQSQPKGLLLLQPFTAGTRDPVIATYSASCCQPRVTITAYDAANNLKTVTLDVTDIWLSDAAIAAIVVGVILFIVLVILIIIWCVWCIRRRKQSGELPVYRSRARSRQE